MIHLSGTRKGIREHCMYRFILGSRQSVCTDLIQIKKIQPKAFLSVLKILILSLAFSFIALVMTHDVSKPHSTATAF